MSHRPKGVLMNETKVQIGNDVLLDIGIHSDWYIGAVGYDGESVDVKLYRKVDQYKEWWLVTSPQTERIKTPDYCDICNHNGCDNCIANSLDDYCVPSGYVPKDISQTNSVIPKNALRSDCTGCRFVGMYDTQFPCANCVRKNKDYYDSD